MEKLESNPMQQGALTRWQQMVKKIGKGTGKYAETYRRDARKYMQQCRNDIPAWIMPLYRVAEQVEAEPEIFDVVIVDESSQTGPEGLILQYLAKQSVIVGDDKQISPEGGFVEGSQVRVLMEQHLDGIPFSETLGPATSLFDQAAVRYGNRITLREHFRCMPEIIRFSNELCYTDTPLIPLRQYPPTRLPPIQVRFVTDGYREGKSQDAINRPEAAASRPRDQAWLFHSIRESDLHPDCMRRRLLSFYYNPNANTLNLNGRGRNISNFQREVGEALSRAGFRLLSEYEVAGRFIDWVVEDRERRLAIECDGDTWHGPDRYEADMARQRMLERCGWKFIRIRGSIFYANQSKAIEELIRAIRAHGLEPCTITGDEAVPRDWIEEVSGNECREALGAYTVDMAEENIVQPRELFPEESEGSAPGGAASPTPRATEIEAAERRSAQSITPLNPVGVNRFLDALKPEVVGNGAPPTPPPAANPPPTARASAQQTTAPRTPGEASPATRQMGRPAPTASTSSPPAPAKPVTTVVSVQERKAVFKALDEAGEPLIMWQIAQGSKISQRRIEEIIPVLVREGFVKRVETAHATMYSRA